MSSELFSTKIMFYFNHRITEVFSIAKGVDNGEDEAEQGKILTTTENVVLPGDILAKIIFKDHPQYFDTTSSMEELPKSFIQNNSKNVIFDSNKKEYQSLVYGFAKIVNYNEIVVEPMLDYLENKMKAWIYIYQSPTGKWPTMQNIKNIYEIEKILFPLEDSQVKPFLDKIIEKKESGKKLLIAEGTSPKSGKPQIIELKKSIELTVGKLDETGRIDYKEKETFISVKENEVIAEIHPEIPPENGVDVFGNTIPAYIVGENPYRIGSNLKKDEDNPKYIIATANGVLEIDEDGKINVENKLTIPGNVNLETGNIHFPGTVEIKGSIEPGFIVEAEASVLVHNNVEDSKVIAGGNITILNGIIGKEHVSIKCKGNIRCKFSQNATLKADGDIYIKEYAIQTKAFAKKSISVGGAVIGGEVIARHKMIVVNAGSSSGVKTLLTAGRDPDIEERIAELNKENNELVKKQKDVIEELTQYFGEDFISKIKVMLPKLPKHRKISAVKLVKSMSEVNNSLTKIKAEKEKLKNQMTFAEPPSIKVMNDVYPEVYIRIGTSIKKLENSVHKPHFREDPVKKIIVWSQASGSAEDLKKDDELDAEANSSSDKKGKKGGKKGKR